MKKYTKYTDLEQASRDPSLAIITDRITTPEELNKLYAKYRILPKKQKRYSNYYSTEFQGRRVSEMYVLMKDKFKPGGELSEDWQMPKGAFVVSEPDLYYKEESFNKGDTNICFILGHSGSGKSRMASTLEGNVIQMVPLQALFIFYCSFLLNLWYSIEAGVFSRLHIIFRRDINGTEKKQLFRQAGIRPVRGRRVRRPWQYMEISISGSEIRRRNFPPGLYYPGTDIWLYHDHR